MDSKIIQALGMESLLILIGTKYCAIPLLLKSDKCSPTFYYCPPSQIIGHLRFVYYSTYRPATRFHHTMTQKQ